MADKSLQANSGSYTIVGAAAFAALVLAVASGSYTVTGTAASLVYGHPITAVSGVYTITGQPIQSRRITAEPAGYILNGTPATLTKSNRFVFASASGSYTVTGSAVSAQKAIPYTKGTYGLTGSVATLLRSSAAFSIPIVSGTYSITGQSAGLTSTVTIETGDYGLTGTVANLRKGKAVQALPGTYTVNGVTSITLEQSRHFPAAVGTYGLTGTIVTLRYSNSTNIFLVANPGIYTVSPDTALLRTDRLFASNSGSYTISGGHTVFKKQFDSGSYTYTGFPVSFAQTTRVLTATPGSYTVSGIPANLVYSIRRLVVDSGVYLLASTGNPTLGDFILVNVGGLYTFTGASTFLRSTRMPVDAGVYAITGGVTNLRASRVGRWRTQSRQPAASSPQPKSDSNWDPQRGASGV